MDLEIDLEPARVARVLLGLVAALNAAYLITRVLITLTGLRPSLYPFHLFDLDDEVNLPSLFSGALHLTAAALLGATAAGERRRGASWLPWFGLCLLFAFLAGDEWLSIHERLSKPVHWLLRTGGTAHYAWVVPYGLFTVGVGVACRRFLIGLPARTRNLFLLAGAMFVAGAIGCEFLGGVLLRGRDRHDPLSWVQVVFEENLEMTGIVLFICAILSHARAQKNGLSVRFQVDEKR